MGAAEKLVRRDQHIRESWITAMEARLVREELVKCRKSEGVNSYVECKHLADLYMELVKDASVGTLYVLQASGLLTNQCLILYRLKDTDKSMYLELPDPVGCMPTLQEIIIVCHKLGREIPH